MPNEIIERNQSTDVKSAELTGARIKTLRTSLEKAFPASANFEIFLSERLERKVYQFFGPSDPVLVAYFCFITQAVAEGWAKVIGAIAYLRSRTLSALLTSRMLR